ncbi:GT-D fold domain-containing glycosyltransferase [Arthrobacter citreus]|uniref:GT-D fold domain-containing glycosyltransferase n=1 Tax=Arthrobacter TaxID=1663 RepID=UPI00126545A9|nr:GT-D fold domain-containing glycosyltransferase [Arthrobacter gandavensis]
MDFNTVLQELPSIAQIRTGAQDLQKNLGDARVQVAEARELLEVSHEVLKESRDQLHSLTKLTEASNRLLEAQNAALLQQLEATNKSNAQMQSILSTLEGVRLAATAPLRADMEASLGGKQLSMLDTIHHIADKGLSFARYGDGEIRLMTREEYNLRFQKNAPGLKSDLTRVLGMSSENLLIGMPHRFVNSMWGAVFAENWSSLKPHVDKATVFGDSHVSRPIFFDFYQQAAVDAWRSVWNGRDALIVAGRGSRFELIDELFGNLGQAEFVEGAPRNAYVEIDSIMQDIISKLHGKDLVLIALGPSGTIIAARLAEMGIQAIDIGHIAASYRSVFSGDAFPELQPVSQFD